MKLSDVTLGWRVQAPFDRIIVTGGRAEFTAAAS